MHHSIFFNLPRNREAATIFHYPIKITNRATSIIENLHQTLRVLSRRGHEAKQLNCWKDSKSEIGVINQFDGNMINFKLMFRN
jgi:hypothetical protein